MLSVAAAPTTPADDQSECWAGRPGALLPLDDADLTTIRPAMEVAVVGSDAGPVESVSEDAAGVRNRRLTANC
jgi:hypothetical protein